MNTTRIEKSLHCPVLIKSLMSNIWPVKGIWIDCTFGAGGYTKALLEAGADKVISIDRDPDALSISQTLKDKYCDKIDCPGYLLNHLLIVQRGCLRTLI